VVGVDLRRARVEGRGRVEHGRQHLVLDFDESRGLARQARVVGCHRGQHVADAPDFLASGTNPASRRTAGRTSAAGTSDAVATATTPGTAAARLVSTRTTARARAPTAPGAVQQTRTVEVRDVRPHAKRRLASADARQPGPDSASSTGSGRPSPRSARANSSMASMIFT